MSCTIATYSVDPPALDAFHVFDPESYVVVSAIADALIYIDSEGGVRPALAVSWRQTSLLEWEFDLRRDVRFFDGEPFDADSVVATFAAHKHPDHPTVIGRGILAPIAAVTRVAAHTVRMTTAFPDVMLLRRLFFSQIYSARALAQHGPGHFLEHPDGIGAYRLLAWHRGKEIVLGRNPDHWAHRATIDEVRIKIARQTEWVDLLRRGEVDMAWSLDGHDVERLRGAPAISVMSRTAALSHWFLLANHGNGPLSDRRVRQAMNHAVHQPLLLEVAEHGRGVVQTSVASAEAEGHNPELAPYSYNPDIAKHLLAEAGYPEGFKLRGLVCETSTAVYMAIKEFLLRIGIELEAEIMPRAEWFGRIVGGNMTGRPYDGDFALSVVDNPCLDSLFAQFVFLFSQGPFSLTRSLGYDQAFLKAATTVNPDDPDAGRRELEAYAHREALILFTIQQHVYVAGRTGFSTATPRSGHFNTDAFWSLRGPADPVRPIARPRTDRPAHTPAELQTLVDATSHLGTFYLPPNTEFAQDQCERLWNNISVAEQRWRLQIEPMMKELVTQVEAKNNLANVMRSTERVAIIGYTRQGRRTFVNRGFAELVCADDSVSVASLIDAVASNPRSTEIMAAVDAEGSWIGAVNLPAAGRRPGAASHLHLMASVAVDEIGGHVGYTFVFSDFSGEEERIRNQAIRTILDNVPYGLIMVDRSLCVLDGYSSSCDEFFTERGPAIRGKPLSALLGLVPRMADHLEAVLGQVFDDWLPEEVSLGQIQQRLETARGWISLTASVIRDGDAVGSLLLSMIDISSLIEAQHREEDARGTLQVLRHRERFASFARVFDATLDELLGAAKDAAWQRWARGELHTAKGVLAQYSLMGLARQVHAIEDEDQISDDQIRQLRARLHAVIDEHRDVWDIDLERTAREHTVTDEALDRLGAELQADPGKAAQVAATWIAELRQRRFRDVLGPLDEAVVQLAARREKHVHFELHGGDTLIPVGLESLTGAVSHLTRNAVDHGVERDEERAGKNPIASVRVSARSAGGILVIEVSDDGRGIDVDAVRDRALAMNAITEDQARRMTRDELARLVFTDALSTASTVTESSGRGVGMRAALDIVDRLGGRIDVRSERGRGTVVEIAVPIAAPPGLSPVTEPRLANRPGTGTIPLLEHRPS